MLKNECFGYQTVSDCVLLKKIHAELLMKLTEGIGPDGTIAQIGQIVIDWVCMVATYCCCLP